jgi:hypothetical protein
MTRYQKFAGRVRITNSAPSQPVEGDEFFDNTTGRRHIYDGSYWRYVEYTTTSTTTSSSTTTSTSTTTS